MAWSHDDLLLVNQAEKGGFREKNFLSTVLEILSGSKAGVSGVSIEVPKLNTIESQGTLHTQEVLKRREEVFWVIIDDIDKSFKNSPEEKFRIATFFEACAELNKSIPSLKIRTSIKPNTWKATIADHSNLSNFHDCNKDLSWKPQDIYTMLVRRVEAYCKKNHTLPEKYSSPDLYNLVFDTGAQWGKNTKAIYDIAYTLGMRRPRWIIELCKQAGLHASNRGHVRIQLEDLSSNLYDFGGKRIDDISSEFNAYCNNFKNIILAFNGQKEEFSSLDLYRFTDDVILQGVAFTLPPTELKNAETIVGLLFEIGFIVAKIANESEGSYDHYTFADDPSLAKKSIAIRRGVIWEVNIPFRQCLGMRDANGKAIKVERAHPRGR